MNNLLIRSLTGLILVIVVMGSIILHPITFGLIGLLIVVGIQTELNRIINSKLGSGFIPGSLIISILAFSLSFLVASGIADNSYLILLILPVLFLLVSELYSKKTEHFSRVSITVFSIIYSVLPYILMLFASFTHIGNNSILNHGFEVFNPVVAGAFFALIWINDTGAYLVGVSIGKHRLFERISPKKSWEGFFGGLLLSIIVAWFFLSQFDLFSRTDWIIIATLTSIGSTLGDLFESVLKRDSGIKDSGSVLPGHGGFLDRFDGVTIAFPLVYLYITFFG